MVFACSAQRWREAKASLGVVGDEGSGLGTGELVVVMLTVGWRSAMRSSYIRERGSLRKVERETPWAGGVHKV